MKLKTKIIFLGSVTLILFLVYYVCFSYPVSSGKRIGNLTKLSLKGKMIKTWEGTINEGYGEKLTTNFSISDDQLAKELFAAEGREVVIYYDEYFFGWPRDTNYNVIRWEHMQHPEDMAKKESLTTQQLLINALNKATFCSFLGTLKQDEELYQKVKSFMEVKNYFLFKQYEMCNAP